jgi:lipopolysaccharide transport system ATP-binding protein
MSNVVIRAEDISKQYRLGLVGTGTVKDDFKRWYHKVQGKEDPFLKIGDSNDRSTKGESNYVWSLKDINFEINQGDSVGIIGKNGAGKSTLLKILSQVTQPTTGKIYTKGRIASLLEVGTGFHPEMTGRENIYLNGAILGMRKKEIARKMEEIIDFSGVERYIDTPVKRYSSGMYVRLAFAVAAHLESEILIVDEVLAVGDAEFQKKCLGKMGDVTSKDGRTVLFVSHNMSAISSICSKGILLENGLIKKTGTASIVLNSYLSDITEFITQIIDFKNFDYDRSQIEFLEFGLRLNDNPIHHYTKNTDDVQVYFRFNLHELVENLNFGIAVYDSNDQLLFISLNTDESPETRDRFTLGQNQFILDFPKNLLNEGDYQIELIASVHFKNWILEPNKNSPRILIKIQEGLSESELWISKRIGILAPNLSYKKVQ